MHVIILNVLQSDWCCQHSCIVHENLTGPFLFEGLAAAKQQQHGLPKSRWRWGEHKTKEAELHSW